MRDTDLQKGFIKYATKTSKRCHDIHTKFHEDWFMNSKVDEGVRDTQTAWRSHKKVKDSMQFPRTKLAK
jgi:hypothetical protein